uniref:Gypsy retrotransposon integrase-like protein 1 n=1 Tax=Xenopus tropicalis TaxID=8364 RepID=A0A6I8RAB1_XENTR
MDPEEAVPDVGRALRGLASRMEAYESQQVRIGQVLDSILSRLPVTPAVAEIPPAVVVPLPAMPPAREPRIPPPPRYSGNPQACRGFVTQCQIQFEFQPSQFSCERAKVGYVMSRLEGKPLEWATSLWESQSPLTFDVKEFLQMFRTIFDAPGRVATASSRLLQIRQGSLGASEYAIDFRTLMAETSWNEEAYKAVFYQGLSSRLKDDLVSRDLPDSLEDLIALAIKVDTRLKEHQADKERNKKSHPVLAPRFQNPMMPPSSPQFTSSPSEEPMQLGKARLSAQEKLRRRLSGLCLYCGGQSHLAVSCPVKLGNTPASSKTIVSFAGSIVPKSAEQSHQFHVPVQIRLPSQAIPVSAFLDSGAAGNFMDLAFAKKVGISLFPVTPPIRVLAIDDRPLSTDTITLTTGELSVQIGALHLEKMSFLIIPCPSSPVVLGLPWLRLHNPSIDWSSGQISRWSQYCQRHCLILRPLQRVTVSSTSLSALPSVYRDFSDVFCKKSAEFLPPHRRYDCPIDLLPGIMPPRGRTYPLSPAETAAMKEYISENLQRGFIRPSTSPAGAGFFFVEKKDGGLRPCIDYRGLNKITVKNRYPLPLISELFDQLKGAKIFSKLDLRGAYNLIRIREGDEWKTAFNTRDGHYEYLVMPFGLCNAPAVFQEFVNDIFRDLLGKSVVVYLDDILIFSQDLETHRSQVKEALSRLRENSLFAKLDKCTFEVPKISFLGYIISSRGFEMDPAKVSAIQKWPLPQSTKAIQRFIGFANYYRQFIKGFSSRIAPILSLIRKGGRPNCWPPVALEAFQSLKDAFISASVLRHPEPHLPFFIEVDASDVGAGAILSQRHSADGKLHPCAYFSKKFSSAEQNYDIGNRELLAVKLALEEWRHLLEGASHPVTIYTDHKNLEFLQSLKRQNPRQARWSLFFSRFHFVLTYRPGTKNRKADALSRSFSPEDRLPIEREPIIPPSRIIASVLPQFAEQILLSQSAAPPDTPIGMAFVPPELRLPILQQTHSSKQAGHPGSEKTLELLQRLVWWPTIRKDVRDFVAACTVCATTKASHSRPCGLLHPLPVPSRPWTHLGMDFIVELPPSCGNTVIWVVIDRFSKMAHFVPLRKLPSAVELAQLFIQHIFRLHGFPVEIVSDRGSQFVSRFWRSLCKSLGVSLQFSSAYHPQTNGAAERVNQALEQFLRNHVSLCQDDWSDLLPWAEFAHNNASHSSTGRSPFLSVYGQHPLAFPQDFLLSKVPAADDLAAHMSVIWAATKSNLEKSSLIHKTFADRRRKPSPPYKVGEKVWLSSKNIRLKVPSPKLGPKFLGPFSISEVINPVAVRLQLPPEMRIPNVFHVSLLKPVVLNHFSSAQSPPSAVLVDGQQEYEVEKILDSRLSRGSLQYLVQWKGFGPEECSWEKDSDVHASRLVKAFHGQFPQKPWPSGPVAPRGGGVLSGIGDAPYLACGGVLPPGAANPRWRRPGLHVGARTPAR